MPQAVAPHLIPVNVKTYGQGFLKLQGWIVFSLLAFVTAGLLCLYELLIINVEDQDFRDMLFDYRVTRPGISYQHKHFANAQYCCHNDSSIFKFSCKPDDKFKNRFGHGPPHCPPIIEFTCPNLSSSSCNDFRAMLYPAVGLDLQGRATNCSRAGQVLLHAHTGPSFHLQLAANPTTRQPAAGQQQQQLPLPKNTSQIDPLQVQEFVTQVMQNFSDPMFRLPRLPLGHSLSFEGRQLLLSPQLTSATGDRWGDFGWAWELWPWPPSSPCSNTGTPATLHLAGSAHTSFKPFNSSAPPVFNVTMFGESLAVPQYQLVLEPGSGSSSSGQQDQVTIRALTHIDVAVGLLPQLGGCEAWQVHRPGLRTAYDLELWAGPPERLEAASVSAETQLLALRVRDVSEPQPLALPRYHGELYVYVALVLGGIWMFASVPLIILFGLVFINVQRNRGMPIFLYKYMRKYRGW